MDLSLVSFVGISLFLDRPLSGINRENWEPFYFPDARRRILQQWSAIIPDL